MSGTAEITSNQEKMRELSVVRDFGIGGGLI
jgi:hypothetical protein